MTQEWILSNFREYYEKWDAVRSDTFENAKFKRYRLSLERYAKYEPPLTLTLLPVNYTGDPFEVVVNAVAQEVNVSALITADNENPEITLEDRTLQYSVNEPGVLTVTESWDGQGLVWVYGEAEGWIEATDETGYGG